MSDHISYTKLKIGSERNFGFVFVIVFLIISFYPTLYGNYPYILTIIIAGFIFVISLTIPKFLRVPNYLWHRLGLLIGKITSPIVMGIIFFVSVVPTGLILKLLKKDILNLNIKKNVDTYWINKKENSSSMKKQF